MKRITVVFCSEAVFRIVSPISFLTEANIQKAINFLENGGCDSVYIILDHFDLRDKLKSQKYVMDFVEGLDDKIRNKIIISTSSKPYYVAFHDYINGMRTYGEIFVNVLAGHGERFAIESNINAIDSEKLLFFGSHQTMAFQG